MKFKTKNKFYILIVTALIFFINQDYYYNKKNTELTGLFRVEAFSRIPDTGDHGLKDDKVYYYILNLFDKINVNADKDDKISRTAKEISRIQIVNTKNIDLKKFAGKQVKVIGMLFYGITAHHFTDVLIDIDEIKMFE